MKYSINVNSAIAAAVAVLNNAGNWYKITMENAETGKKEEFCATGINVYQDSFIKFSRQFAKSRYITDGITDVTAAAYNMIHFTTEAGDVWTVKAYHNYTLADVDKATGNAAKPETLIDWTRTLPTENGGLIVVLDLRKLGRLNAVQEARIEKYMNVMLDGLTASRQKCRTIYYRQSGKEIYSGLFDLEADCVMTEGILDSGDFAADPASTDKDEAYIAAVRQLVAYAAAELEKGEEVPF